MFSQPAVIIIWLISGTSSSTTCFLRSSWTPPSLCMTMLSSITSCQSWRLPSWELSSTYSVLDTACSASHRQEFWEPSRLSTPLSTRPSLRTSPPLSVSYSPVLYQQVTNLAWERNLVFRENKSGNLII